MSTTLRDLAPRYTRDGNFTLAEVRDMLQRIADERGGALNAADEADCRWVLDHLQGIAVERGVTDLLATAAAGKPLTGALANAVAPLHKADGERPIYLTTDGVFSVNPGGQPPLNDVELGDALFRAARLVDARQGNVFDDVGATEATCKAAFERLQATIGRVSGGGQPPAGLSPAQAEALRSFATTLVYELIESRAAANLRPQLVEYFEKRVGMEPDLGLKEQLITNLMFSPLAKTEPVKSAVERMAKANGSAAYGHATLPYDRWFANGNTELKVLFTVGRGQFWKGFTDQLKAGGFKPEGPESQYGVTTYVKRAYQPGVGETVFRVDVREGGTDILDGMGRYPVVGYDGHSNWGRNMSLSLQNGPALADGGEGTYCFINLCFGKNALDSFRKRYPNADITTTYASSSFSIDKQEQMTTGEGIQAFLAWVEGVSKRASVEELDRAMNAAANIGGPRSWSNYITSKAKSVIARVSDRDNDGRANYLDRVYDVNPFAVADDTRREFTPIQQPKKADELRGEEMNAVAQMLNTFGEFSSILDRINQDSKVVPAGYFEPEPGETSLARFQATNINGNAFFLMQVNARYAHMTEEGLCMVAAYEFNRWANQNDLLGLGAVDGKVNGLILAAQSLRIDDSTRDTELWGQFLEKYALPEIPLNPILQVLTAEHHHYAGSLQMVQAVKAKLGADVLRALAQPACGEPV